MTTSIYKIDELIQDTPAGKSLNPRATFGWNDELADIVNNQAIAYTSIEAFITDILTDDSTEVQRLLTQFDASPKPRTLTKLTSNYLPTYGYGTNAKRAIQSATRNLNRKYKQLMAGQYENPTAFKWTYLNPKYLNIYKIDDSAKNLHILLLCADH